MRPTFPPKALKLGGLALAVLVAGSGLVLALHDDPEPAAQIRLAAAKRGVVTASVTAAGNTVDGSRRDLGFGGSGTVTKLYVKVGAKVKKGQVLARVDSTAAREDYTAATADLAAAEEALNTASTAATSTASCSPSSGGTTGGTTSGTTSGTTGGTSASVVGAIAGKAAFGPSAVPIADAAPTTTLTPATTPTPRPTWTPTPEPTPTGHEPQPTVTVTVTATATVTATVTATPGGGQPSASPTGKPSATPTGKSSAKPTAKPTGKATGKPTGKATGKPTGKPGASGKPTGKATPGTRQSQGGSPCSGANGKGGISEDQASANVDRAQAALEQAADEVRGTRIVAPASGTVLSVAGSVGDTAGTSTFISLGDLNELQVDAMVTESDVNKLKLGQEASITLATRGSEKYAGKVTRIAPTATVSDKLVRYSVTLAFDKPPRGLMLGQTASVSVTTGTANDGIYVPAEAVKSRADGTTVVTVRSGGHDSARVVRTGVRGDQYVEITSGLSESDQVVMAGSATGEFPDASWPES